MGTGTDSGSSNNYEILNFELKKDNLILSINLIFEIKPYGENIAKPIIKLLALFDKDDSNNHLIDFNWRKK